MKFKLQSFLCILLVLGGMQFSYAAITIEHFKGKTEVKDNPAKILVLDIPSLDNLDALGIDVSGVPGGNLPSYLAKYADKKYLKIGSLFEPDYESINAAEADLAIIGGRSSAKYEQVAAIVPTIDLTVDAKNYLASSKNHIVTLGKIFAKEEKAAQMVQDIDNQIKQLQQIAPNAGKVMILITNAGNTGIYGRNSRLGWLYNEVGFQTVADNVDDRSHGGDGISFEYILDKNPDWLFVIDRDAAIGQRVAGNAAKQVLDNALVHKTTAWQKGQIIYLHPQEAYITSSGYQALSRIMDQIYSAVSAAK